MSLTVLATPIGNLLDISEHAIRVLKTSEVVVGEERRVASTLLKRLGIEQKEIRELNEHTQRSEVDELVVLCKDRRVALISDCGTPGFCDPGADLVALCYKNQVEVNAVPGASSLMTAIMISGQRLDQFSFAGFLPRDQEPRIRRLQELRARREAIFLLEAPYRWKPVLEACLIVDPLWTGMLFLNLTEPTQKILSGKLSRMLDQLTKSEGVLLLLP